MPCPIPSHIPHAEGTNCNKSCYRRAGLKPTKLALFLLCKVSGVKIISEVAPNISDMRAVCLTYIYHRFVSPASMFKYQNCEANQPLYQKTMRAIKGTGSFWGTNGKPPKFSAC